MKLKYIDDMPLVPIRVISEKGRIKLSAHIDFAATKTLVPSEVAEKLGLEFAEFVPVATGGGTILMPLYLARLDVFGKLFELSVACFDLPKESSIQALLGRDILDGFNICLNGPTKEITVEE